MRSKVADREAVGWEPDQVSPEATEIPLVLLQVGWECAGSEQGE